MKKTIIVALIMVMGAAFATTVSAKDKNVKKGKKEECAQVIAPSVVLASDSDSLAYAVGQVMTEGLIPFAKQRFGITDEQIPVFIEGFVAALKNDTTIMLKADAEAYIKMSQDRKVAAQKKVGEDFLKENATKEGVHTTASGLQYRIITEGHGEIPGVNDNVEVHYEGRLIDGKVFDSSYRRGQTITFKPSGVIKGWTEALTMMPIGSKWELYIPYNLGYGERGAGADIPPYATLIFTVESISKK